MDPEELLNEKEGSEPQKESPLKSLERDLKIYNESIKDVAITIMMEGMSSYPIFVAHQHEVKLGEVILDRNELNTDWTINASTLEEFIEAGVIKAELKDRFLRTYKKPEDVMCVFVVVPEGANFVYYPYNRR
ncbi:MAG: hypothetical protein ABIN91_01845 [Mucilaginibacter sp.]|uniref:hypothetical protein n=1 Tax=Mucilaginibacter sp. TaxID=1882438 RepID=UPI003264D834